MAERRVCTFFLVFLIPALAFLQKIQPLTHEGDSFFAQRADFSRAKEALKKYHQALAVGEDAFEIYWRMARVESWIADRTDDKIEKMKILDKGILHAKLAVNLSKARPEGHYWLGVNYGIMGIAKGTRKSISLVKKIKEEMKKVRAIDPLFANGGADRILGRVYYELPEQAGGSKLRSLKHLLKSKEYGVHVGLTRCYLADTYIALKKFTEAREELEFIISMEPDPNLIPETEEAKDLAQKKLEELTLMKE